MWFDFPPLTIVFLNCLGIPVIHLGVAWLCEQIADQHFDRPLSNEVRPPGQFYEKYFLIKRWKHRLPDAAPWFEGFPKKNLESTEPAYLRKFILETRRGEFSHWLQWILISAFIAWNPFPADLVILLYAAASNFPCLLNLRHTRQRLIPILQKRQ